VAVLIDTDVLVERERDRQIDAAIGSEERAISVISVSELLHGSRRSGRDRARRLAVVEQVLAEFEAIPITEGVARLHAEVWADLASRGDLVGAHDLWIGATALFFGWGVVTHDGLDFGRIPGLRVIEP
jgi:tRNA(fMet)-specific endonuclease VapC